MSTTASRGTEKALLPAISNVDEPNSPGFKAPLIAKFVRALAEAIHIFKTDKDSTLKIIGKFTRITNPDSLDRTHQAFAKILPENPSPSPEGVKTYLDYLAASRPEAAKANPREFVDLSFAQELQASGWIRQLYSK